MIANIFHYVASKRSHSVSYTSTPAHREGFSFCTFVCVQRDLQHYSKSCSTSKLILSSYSCTISLACIIAVITYTYSYNTYTNNTQTSYRRGVQHQPKSCTRFRNPKISGKISDFSHFILKTFCSFLLCYHSNNKLLQLLADFSKQRIKYLVLKLWFLTYALVRNYTVSSLMILEILNFA